MENENPILGILADVKPELERQFQVKELALFGSVRRGEERPDSDIDILVSFDGPATSDRHFGVLFFLEDLLGRPVDLVTRKAIREEMRPYIEKEALYV